MTKNEALKMALELAEDVRRYGDSNLARKGVTAITTLREVLTQPVHPAVKSDMLVNGGALKMALNVLRRAGKNEVADELEATAAQPVQPADNGITVDLLEKLSTTLTRLGCATPEGGLEQFGARLPTQLYNLYRAVDGLLKAAESQLVQPEQEPAFYGFMLEEECCVNICYSPCGPGGPNNELPTAYYTSPPQRQWVGLTYAEALELIERSEHDDMDHELVRLVIYKLKEKNT